MSAGWSAGKARTQISCANPRRQKCSMVRAWTALTCGLDAVLGLVSTSRRATDTAPAEFVGKHQAARSTARNEDFGVSISRRVGRPCMRAPICVSRRH